MRDRARHLGDRGEPLRLDQLPLRVTEIAYRPRVVNRPSSLARHPPYEV